MSAKKRAAATARRPTARRVEKPIAPELQQAADRLFRLPATVTVDREWLQERIDWLDVHHFATNVMREVNELASSHREALEEQRQAGLNSGRASDLFLRWGYEAEHCALEELGKILQSIQHVVEDLREVAYPTPEVTP